MLSKQILAVCIACFCISGCGQKKEPEATPAETATTTQDAAEQEGFARRDPGETVNEIFERFFQEYLELNPIQATFIGDPRYNDRVANSVGPEYRRASRALEEKYLAEIQAVDPDTLEGQDLLSYEIFLLERQEMLESFGYPDYLLPMDQIQGLQSTIVLLGSGSFAQPFETVEDYDNFLGRIDGFVVWADQAITNMREGAAEGVVQPRIVVEKLLPQLESQIVDDVELSQFFVPVSNMPEAISREERERIESAYRAAIVDKLVPAYRRLHDYLENEYYPHARKSVGWSALPDGKAWYEFLVRHHTTSPLTAAEIHETGLEEVSRIRGEMEQVMEQVGFEGTLAQFFEFVKTDDRFYFTEPEQLLEGYRDLKARIDALLPQMFSDFPKTDYEIRPVEEFRAESAAGASYQPGTPDGSRAGIFYVNTFNLRAQPNFGMETLSLHEAAPGHHFQISIQQELTGLPKFRRFGGYTSYVEGWALYAESLGKGLGLFTDPYQYYGKLSDEMLRAMRLVVDTGLHSKGWTRQQAIEYMLENSSMAETDVVSEVERYIAWPGQALAYKVGQLKILALRDRAERALGDDFDIKGFHSMLLRGGALPMGVLEARTERWIAEQRDRAAERA